MKSVILYRAPRATSQTQDLVFEGGYTIPVRHEIYEGDIGEALNNAKPRAGETVINTLPLD